MNLKPTLWEYTKMRARRATREYFAPLTSFRSVETFQTGPPDVTGAAAGLVVLGKDYHEEGRSQWKEYAGRGRSVATATEPARGEYVVAAGPESGVVDRLK